MLLQLLGYAFLLSVPVFYLYGLYKFFNRGKANPDATANPDQKLNQEFWQAGARVAREELYRQFLDASEEALSGDEKIVYHLAADFIADAYPSLKLKPAEPPKVKQDEPLSIADVAQDQQDDQLEQEGIAEDEQVDQLEQEDIAEVGQDFPFEDEPESKPVYEAPRARSIADIGRRTLEPASNDNTLRSDLPPPPPPPPPRKAPQPAVSPFQLLENINILLYLGAFFIIVASGIFASYSYESLTGVMKTVLMGVFAAVFYGSGLVMYQRSKNIRPAAVVFTAIGLVAFPLVGLVAYHFWFADNQVQMVWFGTSLVCIGAYFLAYRVIRHGLLEYLSIITALSFFQ
jgi:hypothetical protein